MKTKEEIIEAFHMLWEAFPGPVRLIDHKHLIIAANQIAIDKGFHVGCCCATVGEPCSHNGCKAMQLKKTGCAQYDRPDEQRIRGWVPLADCPDYYVHFTILIPEEA